MIAPWERYALIGLVAFIVGFLLGIAGTNRIDTLVVKRGVLTVGEQAYRVTPMQDHN